MTRNTNGKNFSLKDELFNRTKVRYLAGLFRGAHQDFDVQKFEQDVMEELEQLGLKERIVWIAQNLEKHLDPHYLRALEQIRRALPQELDPHKSDDDFGDFIFAPLGEFVVRNGCTAQYRESSMNLLREITKRFSMEDAVRYFINAFPCETMKDFEGWALDKNYHVRRLVSEGSRPLLPWSGRIHILAADPLPFLYVLYADPTRYVVRSVANHLNDISKVDLRLVVATLERWHTENAVHHKQSDKEMQWLTAHALRTLVKRGDVAALALLGYAAHPRIIVGDVVLRTSHIVAGDVLHFDCEIEAQEDVRLMIDYVIDFVKANGKTAPKVFKLKKVSLQKGEVLKLTKGHRFLANATTSVLYSGRHALILQINGEKYTPIAFTLTV